jgi:hypothetical protein
MTSCMPSFDRALVHPSIDRLRHFHSINKEALLKSELMHHANFVSVFIIGFRREVSKGIEDGSGSALKWT